MHTAHAHRIGTQVVVLTVAERARITLTPKHTSAAVFLGNMEPMHSVTRVGYAQRRYLGAPHLPFTKSIRRERKARARA